MEKLLNVEELADFLRLNEKEGGQHYKERIPRDMGEYPYYSGLFQTCCLH